MLARRPPFWWGWDDSVLPSTDAWVRDGRNIQQIMDGDRVLPISRSGLQGIGRIGAEVVRQSQDFGNDRTVSRKCGSAVGAP
jgi:hypothetical protein